MLRVLPPTFKPVNNLICCKTGLMWVVKLATSQFNLVLQQCCKTSYMFFVVRFFRTLSNRDDNGTDNVKKQLI